MEYPFQNYLYWLILNGLNDQEILHEIDVLDFCIRPEDIPKVKEKLKDQLAGVDLGSASKEHVCNLLGFELNSIEPLKNTLDCPGVKILLEILLFIEDDYDAIAKQINLKYALAKLTKKRISDYVKLFWNIHINDDNWREFHSLLDPWLKEKYRADLLKVSSKVDISHALGVEPNVPYRRILEDVMYYSYNQFKSATTRRVCDADDAKKWTAIIFNAGDRLQKIKDASVNPLEDLKQLKLELYNPKVPFLEELYKDDNMFVPADVNPMKEDQEL